MSREFSFHRLAEQELNEAAQFYDGRLCGVFLQDIHRCIESIIASPYSGAVVMGPIRRRLARRFPYAVIYSVSPLTVRVLAIMNLSRRPLYWAGRH